MKHTKKFAVTIMRDLACMGIKTKLIGSLVEQDFSENDIDLVLLDYPTIDNRLIAKLKEQFYMGDYVITNWGGIFIKTVNYNIDLFPSSYMKKCYYCKKKCCL